MNFHRKVGIAFNTRQDKNMTEKLNIPDQEELNVWIKTQLDNAVWKLIERGEVDSLLVEAKPAWVFPFKILIGKIRSQDKPEIFNWFICGDVPTESLKSTLASSPRDAAKHFSMKWQLQAARRQNPESQNPTETEPKSGQNDRVDQLIDNAEFLYELVDNAKLWQQ